MPTVDRKAAPTGARAVAYTRVSTEQQGASGAGLDAQEHACRMLADREGLDLTAVFTDVRSGSSRKGRTGLADAIAALDKGDTLIVAKLDRLARNVWEFGDIVREVDSKGARILVGDAPISDMSSPAGRAFVQMLAVFADFERGMAQARTLEAVAVKRAQGKDLGGRRKGCFLVPEETRSRVRLMRARGWTLRRIAEELNAEGVPAGRGGRWHPESVRLVCR